MVDCAQIWRGLGVETHDESLSAHCGRTGTCAESLQVVTPQNAMTLEDEKHGAQGSGAPSVRVRFYQRYRCDAQLQRIDAVVCSHPAALCELYLPLGIPTILYVTTRFDLGRLHSVSVLQVLPLSCRVHLF